MIQFSVIVQFVAESLDCSDSASKHLEKMPSCHDELADKVDSDSDFFRNESESAGLASLRISGQNCRFHAGDSADLAPLQLRILNAAEASYITRRDQCLQKQSTSLSSNTTDLPEEIGGPDSSGFWKHYNANPDHR